MAESPLVIEVQGLEELQKALGKFSGDWQQIATKALGEGMNILADQAAQNAPKDQGTLYTSIGSKTHPEGIRDVSRSGSTIVGRIGSKVIYAAAHEFGVTITPKKGKWLRFQTKDGLWHTVASVTIRKKAYMQRAIEQKGGQAVKAFEKGIDEALRRLNLK